MKIILCIALFLFTAQGAQSREALPDAGEVVLRQLLKDHKDLLSRFGYFVYNGEGWQKFGEGNVPKRAVVLVHGLDEMGTVWDDMAPVLHQKDYKVLKFAYPNDQAISHSAILFREQLKWLNAKGTEEVTLVAHSMGGLVCRDALTRPDAYPGSLPKVRHLITLGTPNHGAPLAPIRHVGEWREYLLRLGNGEGNGLDPILDGMGEAAVDLTPESDYLKELNARPLPKIPITIIAGRIDQEEEGTPQEDGKEFSWVTKTWQKAKLKWKAVTEKVGDGVVPLDSTPLEGVDDYRLVRGNHRSILKNFFKGDELPPGVKIVLEILEEK